MPRIWNKQKYKTNNKNNFILSNKWEKSQKTNVLTENEMVHNELKSEKNYNFLKLSNSSRNWIKNSKKIFAAKMYLGKKLRNYLISYGFAAYDLK